MSEPLVTHISDTALWIAAHRAEESRRPDALFRDPFAERLAGERGRRIAARLSAWRDNWPMVVRTRLIDDLVAASIEQGADRVLNLAAGLDTRPYRLPLRKDLLWIEADLPGITDEKERLLADERPACRLRRERVDLSDSAARADFLARALDGARRALVITEGLLAYQSDEQVRAIGRDLHAQPAAAWWMIDLASPGVIKAAQKHVNPHLDAASKIQFGPAEGVDFFRPLGWRATEVKHYFREALRLRRGPRWMRVFGVFPDPDPARLGQRRMWGGIVRFARA